MQSKKKAKSLMAMNDLTTPVTRMLLLAVSVIAVIMVGAVLGAARGVFIPLVFAWIISQIFSPMMKYFKRHKVPYTISITFLILLMLFMLYWVAMFLSSSASGFAKEMPELQTKLIQVVTDVTRRLSHHFSFISSERVNAELNQQLGSLIGQLMGLVSKTAGLVTSLVSDIVMVAIMLAFILSGQKYSKGKLYHAFSKETANRVAGISEKIAMELSRYMIMQTLISALTGVLVWGACRVFGVTNAGTWGVLAFFLNFIPTVGSIIAGIPPVMLALLQFYPNVWPAVGTAIAILLINQILGNILTPNLMGDRLDLSPVVILLSLLFWGWLWGLPGAFLSVIISASLRIVCDQIEPLRPIAIFMSSGKRLAKHVSL